MSLAARLRRLEKGLRERREAGPMCLLCGGHGSLSVTVEGTPEAAKPSPCPRCGQRYEVVISAVPNREQPEAQRRQ